MAPPLNGEVAGAPAADGGDSRPGDVPSGPSPPPSSRTVFLPVPGRMADTVRRLLPLAARTLGWCPDTFWAATPADLALALADPAAPAGELTRADLDRLLETDRHG